MNLSVHKQMWVFWTRFRGAQGLLLALYSGITFRGLGDTRDQTWASKLQPISRQAQDLLCYHSNSKPVHFIRLLTFFSLSRTGLEAIMETYAFWRPPVRTLTFEDFTTMQKQQGKENPGLRQLHSEVKEGVET